jgi:hypothetical protein
LTESVSRDIIFFDGITQLHITSPNVSAQAYNGGTIQGASRQ